MLLDYLTLQGQKQYFGNVIFKSCGAFSATQT